MKNDVIRAEIRKRMSMDAFAKEMGLAKQSLYNKLSGATEWTVTELLELSRKFNWTVGTFLDVIEYKAKEK